MGSFYGSIHLRPADRSAVLAATEAIARKQDARFLVGPVLRGWVAIYPIHNGQDERLPAVFAKRLGGELLHVLVHDDDIFAYRFYRDGKLIDQYNSRPDYFEPVSESARRKMRGRPEKIASLLSDPDRLTELREILSPERAAKTVFASETLSRFAKLLDLPNAETAYEYLMQGETDGIEQWDDFTHVPDLSAENARQQAAADKDAEEMRRWREEGMLLVHESRPTKTMAGVVPCCCADGASGFYVSWADALANAACSVEHYAPPWQTPFATLDIDPGPGVLKLALSPGRRYLAVAHTASGAWHARLLDLTEKRTILDIPQRGYISWIGFGADDKHFFTLGHEDSYGVSLETQERVALGVGNAKLGAVTPDGDLAVVDQQHRLHVVDVGTGVVRKTLILGNRQEVEAIQRAQLASLRRTFANFDEEAFEKNMQAQLEQMGPLLEQMFGQAGKTGPQFEEQMRQIRAQMQKNIELQRAEFAKRRQEAETGQVAAHGSEIVFAMDMSRAGELCLGTSAGLRVFRWEAVQEAVDYMPDALYSVGAAPQVTAAAPSGYLYGVALDQQRRVLFFGGLAGSIESLDLVNGRHRVLRQLPGKAAIVGMALSSDGGALACSVTPDMFDQSRRRKPMELQIWEAGKLVRAMTDGHVGEPGGTAGG